MSSINKIGISIIENTSIFDKTLNNKIILNQFRPPKIAFVTTVRRRKISHGGWSLARNDRHGVYTDRGLAVKLEKPERGTTVSKKISGVPELCQIVSPQRLK